MVQRYFWVADLVLIAMAAALAANMTTAFIGCKLAKPVTSGPEQVDAVAPPQERLSKANYAVISKRNIFNANPPGDTPKVKPKPPMKNRNPAVLPAFSHAT